MSAPGSGAGARGAAVGLVALLMLTACGREEPAAPAAAPTTPSGGATVSARVGDADRGRQVWLGQCVACHHTDPARDGAVGPAVQGSSPELLEARVLRGEYPAGYTPKRPTKVMPPRPDLAPAIPDLAAYLE